MTTILSFLFVIGTCVLIHELAHFWVARRCGVFVEIFSIGFGPPLWKRRIGDTEWRISAIPLGGFVKMKGEEPGDEMGAPDSFHAKSPWARMAIVAAGPLSNLVFAVLLMAAYLCVVGIEEFYLRPVLGSVAQNTDGARAGLAKGDRIVALDGKPVETYFGFMDDLRGRAGETAVLTIHRDPNRTLRIPVPIIPLEYRGDDLLVALAVRGENALFGGARIEGIAPYSAPVIGEAILDRPADRAGFVPGDFVLRVNGEAVTDWDEMATAIRESAGDTLVIDYERNGVARVANVSVDTEPYQKADGTVGTFQAIGIRPESRVQRINPLRALWESSIRLIRMGRMIILTLYQIVTFNFSIHHLMGPVGIAQASGQSAARGELLFFLWLVSANLGFVNCVPFPIFDGGYLFLFLPYEILMKRKPSARFVEITHQAALGMILLFFAVVTYNDVLRWARHGTGG